MTRVHPVSPPRPWPAAVAAIGGGGAVMAGSLLPWMTLFAGLHVLPGITGAYGWGILAGGTLAVAGGVGLLFRPMGAMGGLLGGLGAVLLGASVWLIVQQRTTLALLLELHPMTVAGWGPGLFLVACGSLAVVCVPLLRRVST